MCKSRSQDHHQGISYMLGMPSLTQVPNFILAAVSCFYSMNRLALCADFRQTLLEAADLRKALKDNQRGVKPAAGFSRVVINIQSTHHVILSTSCRSWRPIVSQSEMSRRLFNARFNQAVRAKFTVLNCSMLCCTALYCTTFYDTLCWSVLYIRYCTVLY